LILENAEIPECQVPAKSAVNPHFRVDKPALRRPPWRVGKGRLGQGGQGGDSRKTPVLAGRPIEWLARKIDRAVGEFGGFAVSASRAAVAGRQGAAARRAD
jgi:hypothetical protein